MSHRFNVDCLQNSKLSFTGRYAQSAKRLISIGATGSTAANATFPSLCSNELVMVILKKKERKEIKPRCAESYLIAIFKQANDQVSDLHKYPFIMKDRILTFHTVAILSKF